MLNNVVNWDIKFSTYVHGQELSCDIMNLSHYFTYLYFISLLKKKHTNTTSVDVLGGLILLVRHILG